MTGTGNATFVSNLFLNISVTEEEVGEVTTPQPSGNYSSSIELTPPHNHQVIIHHLLN